MISLRPLERIANAASRLRERHPLSTFISGRILTMVIMLFLLGFGVFGLMSLAPGDIVDNYVRSQMLTMTDFRSSDNSITQEQIKEAKHRLGLDLPFYDQYLQWLRRVLIDHDLGRSLISKAPVLFLVSTRMINSIILNLISLVFLTIISFGLGIYFSSKAGTKIDPMVAFVSLFLNAFPGILMLLLLQLFAASTGWFPVTAYPTDDFTGKPVAFAFSYLYHIILPLIGAFLGGIGGSLRLIRATMLDQLGQPYITALRSRGIGEPRIYLNHAFRNTMNPFITSSSNLLADLFSGSLILEIIFSYPGIGRLMYEAVLQKDINLVMTNVMFISFLILLGMVLSDIALALVDPRIRYARS
ncbi:MAG TPA: ABC transporter permease [Spirochaetia bacterium]|nr:ABC transporter permease [Spirochaetia bacterium]